MKRKKSGQKAGNIIMLVVALSAGAALLAAQAPAQVAVEEGAVALQDRARQLEQEIAGLGQRLAEAKKDWLVMMHRLQDIEKKIVDCYMEIDAVEAELDNARKKFNKRLRLLYMEGRDDALAELLASDDVSDVLVRYEYVTDVAATESDGIEEIRSRRKKLLRVQEQLIDYKKQAASLATSADTSGLEAEISRKRAELADVMSRLIAGTLPSNTAPAPSTFDPGRVYSEPDENGYVRTGQVFSGYSSWYGNEFHGKPTASGEVFDQHAFTCAHRTLPFGTYLRVTFRNRNVIVKVNDRGPFVQGRVLDLSRGAAEAIGLNGVQWVDCEIVVPR